MIATLRALAAEGVARWRFAIFISIGMASLLGLGLSIRHQFIAEATVDIGGALTTIDSDFGLMRFKPFEGASEIENYFEHEVIAKDISGRLSACTAKTVYSPDGLRLKMLCKGRSDIEAKGLAASALEPLLARHKRYFDLARDSNERRQKFQERRLNSAEQKIEVLKKPPVSSLAEAQIIGHRLEIELLLARMAEDRLLGNRVKPTLLDADGLKVLDRTPGWATWLVVIFLAIGAGLFTMVFKAMLDSDRHE